MSKQSIAAGLLRLRKDRGLTQGQLAKSAGLSRSAYCALEERSVEPQADVLRALSEALEVSIEELMVPREPLQSVRFRSLKRLKNRDQVLADVSRRLRDFTDLEELIGEPRAHGLKGLADQIEQKRRKDIRMIAALARSHFGLGEREPVHDICGLLESQGVKVFSVKIANDALMGFSIAEEGRGPAVIVNTWDRLPVETWIFSAVHELAHLLLHSNAYDVNEAQEDQTQAQEADQFASHFLLPEAVFLKEWKDAAGLPLADRVFKVKRVFRVSWRTVLYRIAEPFPEEQRYLVWKRFNEEYKQQQGRALLKHHEPHGITREVYQDPHGARSVVSEPAGMEAHDFRQDRLLLLVRRAVEREIIPLSRGAEILRLPVEQMRELSASWLD